MILRIKFEIPTLDIQNWGDSGPACLKFGSSLDQLVDQARISTTATSAQAVQYNDTHMRHTTCDVAVHLPLVCISCVTIATPPIGYSTAQSIAHRNGYVLPRLPPRGRFQKNHYRHTINLPTPSPGALVSYLFWPK